MQGNLPSNEDGGVRSRFSVWTRKVRTFTTQSAGTSAVEFALMAPVLCALMLGVIEGGRVMWVTNQLQTAVEDAAHCGVVNSTTCPTTQMIQAYAVSQVNGFAVTASQFYVTNTTCGLKVTATVPYTGLFFGASISPTLTASFCQPKMAPTLTAPSAA